MAQRTSYEPGTFCWVDLITPDVAGASAFYERVLGLKAGEEMEGGYRMFERDGAPAAGLAALTQEQVAAGVPTMWQTYVSVADVEASAARARELGGTVLAGPMPMPGAAGMAVIADAQGATLMLWQPREFPGAGVVNAVGAWSWSDIQTPEPAVASEFYTGLFGWEINDIPGAGGQYRTIVHGGRSIGGVMTAPPGVEQPLWNVYFGVETVSASVEHVEAAGGRRLAGPFDVPAGRFAAAMDPLGAPFSIFEGGYDD